MVKLLVTGYGGFLGKELCRQLLDRGYQVRGLARNVYPDMERLGSSAFGGMRVVKMFVGKRPMEWMACCMLRRLPACGGPTAVYESINADSTRWLVEAVVRRGIKALVYCSSPSVTFDGRHQSGVDESVPYPSRWLCDYPRTKAIAEQLVLKANAPGRLLTCSLRPHLIWGPTDPHLIPRLIDRCKQGRLVRVGSGKNLIDTVHVESAARAHRLAIEAMLQVKSRQQVDRTLSRMGSR